MPAEQPRSYASIASRVTGILLAILTAAVVVDASLEREPNFLGPIRAQMPTLGRRGLARGGSLYLLWSGLAVVYVMTLWGSVVFGIRQRSRTRTFGRVIFSILLVAVALVLIEGVLYSAAQ